MYSFIKKTNDKIIKRTIFAFKIYLSQILRKVNGNIQVKHKYLQTVLAHIVSHL